MGTLFFFRARNCEYNSPAEVYHGSHEVVSQQDTTLSGQKSSEYDCRKDSDDSQNDDGTAVFRGVLWAITILAVPYAILIWYLWPKK